MKVKTKAKQVKRQKWYFMRHCFVCFKQLWKICMEKHSNTSQEPKPQWNKSISWLCSSRNWKGLLATCFRNPRSNLSISRLKPGWTEKETSLSQWPARQLTRVRAAVCIYNGSLPLTGICSAAAALPHFFLAPFSHSCLLQPLLSSHFLVSFFSHASIQAVSTRSSLHNQQISRKIPFKPSSG